MQPAISEPKHVAIIGGGFSGAILAVNLVRLRGPRATLIERRPVAGRGVAYSAALDDHLLNVRAGNMSAFADDPSHFVRWLAARGLGGPDDFIPRLTYGAYLEELLRDAVSESRGRLAVIQGGADDAVVTTQGVIITLADGGAIEADTLVLAIGNLSPHDPGGMAGLGADIYAADPWDGDIAQDLTDQDTVLIVGTGLTMVDVALLLETRGFGGKIVALSRRGLLPRGHVEAGGHADPVPMAPGHRLSDLVRTMRARAAATGWRAAVDSLRPHTQILWREAGETERRRFVRHLRPYWDVHRHRIAPRIAARIETMLARGRLRLAAGKIQGVRREGNHAMVTWRPRGADAAETLKARRIVNCTGPQTDLARSAEPLLRRLAARGLIRADRLHLGIDVDESGNAFDAGGAAQPRLLAVGPMTRAATWEIVAVPDIRVQAWSVARRLSGLDGGVED